MIAVLQRVSRARVFVHGEVTGAIDLGLVILLGVHRDDSEEDSSYLVEKTAMLRIFADDADKMNLSLLDVGGGALVVSQFTLLGNWRKGRRPSFTRAAPPDTGERLYRHYIDSLAARGVPVSSGRFGARMEVELVNDGPVTFVLDSKER
ncbi:MAG: D-tyrosyl-tRNA(Tyr) deacylase [Candidatus Marinimicrobia bacterium]|nr:D-tyrosyl-tRNA(Tyr) deacylase [Candidatus Neomarinimicrobiota bacterium]